MALNKKELDLESYKRIWDYFKFHATQRLTTFNFYIVLSTVLVSALFTVMVTNKNNTISFLLAFLLLILSFVFWKLDCRNKELIKGVEEAIIYLESLANLKEINNSINPLNIFSKEKLITSKKRKKKSIFFWRNFYSYSICFNIIFISFSLASIMFMIFFIFHSYFISPT